jgi:hypothetical protein
MFRQLVVTSGAALLCAGLGLAIIPAKGAAQSQCQACDDFLCEHPSVFQHDLHSFYLPADGNWGAPHGCVIGSCEGHGHQHCNPGDFALVIGLWNRLEAADVSEVADLLRSHDRVARFNVDRRAIQFVGCGNQLIGHMPLREPLEHSLPQSEPALN